MGARSIYLIISSRLRWVVRSRERTTRVKLLLYLSEKILIVITIIVYIRIQYDVFTVRLLPLPFPSPPFASSGLPRSVALLLRSLCLVLS